jgi:molybdate transport system substrate-binding protein
MKVESSTTKDTNRHLLPRATAIAALFCAIAAHAGEVKVISPSAMHSSLDALVEAYRKQSGDEIKLSFETAPALPKRLASGETADIIIVPPAAMEKVIEMGKAAPAGRFELGRVGVGVAVRADAPVPDISNTEALKRAILDAESVAYNRASSGVYVEQLMEKLGLAEQIKAKTVRHRDAQESFTHLLNGKGREIGFGGLTEIVRWRDKGLRLVGPLPADIQNYTVYTAALAADPPNPDGARAFFKFLASPAAKAILKAQGVD